MCSSMQFKKKCSNTQCQICKEYAYYASKMHAIYMHNKPKYVKIKYAYYVWYYMQKNIRTNMQNVCTDKQNQYAQNMHFQNLHKHALNMH